MAEMSDYEPGVPSWVDLGSPDMEASKAFYGGLFGWEANTVPDPAAGGYTLFTLRGKQVAGAGPLMTTAQPPAWSTYVSVADADATAAAVRSAGGTVIMDPMDVMGSGRMAIFADPTGAVVATWQPKEHKGAQLINEPGTLCWNELATRDLNRAKDFYGRVFGWSGETTAGDQMTYTEWKMNGKTVGGMLEMGPQYPADVPAHWLVYFAVDDCDAAVARAEQLGGRTVVSPTDIPPGRFAVLSDPQGAMLALIQMHPHG